MQADGEDPRKPDSPEQPENLAHGFHLPCDLGIVTRQFEAMFNVTYHPGFLTTYVGVD
jgi:hypothetical protein